MPREGQPSDEQGRRGRHTADDERILCTEDEQKNRNSDPKARGEDDLQTVGPVWTLQELATQNLLERLGVDGDTGNLLAQRTDAIVVEPHR